MESTYRADLRNVSDHERHLVCDHPGALRTELTSADRSVQVGNALIFSCGNAPPQVHQLAPGATLALSAQATPSGSGKAHLSVIVTCHTATAAGVRTEPDVEYKAEKVLDIRGPRRHAR